MQGFDENSISKIKVYGRKGKMEAEAAQRGSTHRYPRYAQVVESSVDAKKESP
jgi:hypothetical protein